MTSKKIPSNTPSEGNEMSQSLRDRPPFTQTPDWVALAPISAQAFRLYVLLAGHVNQSRDDDEVWPTHEQLAAMMGLAKPDAIKPYADELVAIGAISRTTIRTHGGMRKRNRYTVRGVVPAGWDGASSIAEFHDHLKEKSQVTPEPPNLGVPEPPCEGAPEPPQKGAPEPPPKGAEPDQDEQDECEPDQPTTGTGPKNDGMVDGWMEEGNKQEEGSEVPPSAGDRLLASVERRNSATLTAKRDEHVATIDAALEVLPQDRVLSVLGDGLDGATSPSGALVSRIRQLPEQVQQRQDERQRLVERDRKLAERDDAPQQPAGPAEDAGATTSPVDWLTVEQYAALPKKDQAQIRAFADTAPEDLTEKASRDLAAIHRKVMELTG